MIFPRDPVLNSMFWVELVRNTKFPRQVGRMEVQVQVPLTVGVQMPGEAGTAEEGKQVHEL